MTVNKNKTSKKKSLKSVSNTASVSGTQQKSSKTTKTLSSKSEHIGIASKSSSASSIHISDVSHLPVQGTTDSYLVTEVLPIGSGEKITVYNDTGTSSTEYRHFIAQDSSASASQSASIQQISSTLNESISNLSCASGSTYTVTEPREEFKLSYNKNDSGWNGKFVMESPSSQKSSTTVVQQSSSSHQERKSTEKNAFSSFVIDGQERIIDQKFQESGKSESFSKDEQSAAKSGTNIVPEVHHKESSKKISTKYDSNIPELQQPKTKSSEAVREMHQFGDLTSSSQTIVKDNQLKFLDEKDSYSRKLVKDQAGLKEHKYVESNTKESTQKSATKSSSIQSSSKKLSNTANTANNVDVSQFLEQETETITTTTTYYDAKGNEIKSFTEIDKHTIPHVDYMTHDQRESITKSVTTYYDSKGDIIKSFTEVDAQNLPYIQGNNLKDSSIDRSSITGTFSSTSDKFSHGNRDIIEAKVERNRKSISPGYGPNPEEPSPINAESLTDKSPVRKSQSSTQKEGNHQVDKEVRWVDEDSNDTKRIRHRQTPTDSKYFFAHSTDTRKESAQNINDISSVQNSIGSTSTVLTGDMVDSKDITYSNDRNYGNTNWNEQSPQSKKFEEEKASPTKSAKQRCPSRERSDKKIIPDYPAGKPSITSETTAACDFLQKEISEDVKQSSQFKDSKDVTWVDENYVDRNKMREQQNATNSKTFYGHSTDSATTKVSNVYDSQAIQNTIASTSTVLKDHMIESNDVIYSNDRNYGKSSWNGQFTYEQPPKTKPSDSRGKTKLGSPSSELQNKPQRTPSRERPDKTRKSPDNLAGKPSVSEKTKICQDFSTKEISNNISQSSDLALSRKIETDISEISGKSTIDSSTAVAKNLEKCADTKTVMIKDSQTFIDNISSEEGIATSKVVSRVVDQKSNVDIAVSSTYVDKKSTKDLRQRDTRSDVKTNTIIKDVKVLDSTDQIDNTFIREDVLTIKDITEDEIITNIKRTTDDKIVNIVKTIKEEPKPARIKVPLKEQCICELCTCGRHSCPHNPDLYNDHLYPEGPIYIQPKDDYCATKGERYPVKKPEDHLHPEGEFVKRQPQQWSPGERAPVKKPVDNLRLEDE